jgi:hypothetical protein
MPWYDITHYVPMWLLWLWRLTLCPRGWHLFDEVATSCDDGPEHRLFCDACELTIHIDDARTATP